MATRSTSKSNYTGVSGAFSPGVVGTSNSDGPGIFLAQYGGLIFRDSKTSLSEAQDGLSNTLMFGELLGGFASPRDTVLSWMGAGRMGTKFGLGPGGPSNGAANTDVTNGGYYCFSSRHNGIVQFVHGDGSVHGYRVGSTTVRNPLPAGAVIRGNPDSTAQGTDWCVLQALAGCKDGYNADINKLGN